MHADDSALIMEEEKTKTAARAAEEEEEQGKERVLLHLLIGTDVGVRVEYVEVELQLCTGERFRHNATIMTEEEDGGCGDDNNGNAHGRRAGWKTQKSFPWMDKAVNCVVVLQPNNGFQAHGIRVKRWGVDACSAKEVSAARYQLPACVYRDSDDDGDRSCDQNDECGKESGSGGGRNPGDGNKNNNAHDDGGNMMAYDETRERERRRRRMSAPPYAERVQTESASSLSSKAASRLLERAAIFKPRAARRRQPQQRDDIMHAHGGRLRYRYIDLELSDETSVNIGYVWIIAHYNRVFFGGDAHINSNHSDDDRTNDGTTNEIDAGACANNNNDDDRGCYYPQEDIIKEPTSGNKKKKRPSADSGSAAGSKSIADAEFERVRKRPRRDGTDSSIIIVRRTNGRRCSVSSRSRRRRCGLAGDSNSHAADGDADGEADEDDTLSPERPFPKTPAPKPVGRNGHDGNMAAVDDSGETKTGEGLAPAPVRADRRVFAPIDGGFSSSSTSVMMDRALPHRPHGFRIENTCGACRTPFELDLKAFRCLRASFTGTPVGGATSRGHEHHHHGQNNAMKEKPNNDDAGGRTAGLRAAAAEPTLASAAAKRTMMAMAMPPPSAQMGMMMMMPYPHPYQHFFDRHHQDYYRPSSCCEAKGEEEQQRPPYTHPHYAPYPPHPYAPFIMNAAATAEEGGALRHQGYGHYHDRYRPYAPYVIFSPPPPAVRASAYCDDGERGGRKAWNNNNNNTDDAEKQGRAPPPAYDETGEAAATATMGSTAGDLITMLSGTFAPCANRIQVDFRGVRSIAAMLSDWALIAGTSVASETTVTLYMLVMKACLGVPALIVDHGIAPVGLHESGSSISGKGAKKCYLAERMAAWCTDFAQHIDVCQAVELIDIKWEKLLTVLPCPSRRRRMRDAVSSVPEPLRDGSGVRSSVHVSRRGGVMLRLIFPCTTVWNVKRERAVVKACDQLLIVLRRALRGQSLP